MLYKFGRKYKHVVSGFTGVAVGFAKYLTGCDQVLIQPPVGADGNWNESQWFDVTNMLEVGEEDIAIPCINCPDGWSSSFLGKRGTDRVSNFEGTITGHAMFTHIETLALVPPVKKDGSYQNTNWFNKCQIEVDEKVKTLVLKIEKPGADFAAPRHK